MRKRFKAFARGSIWFLRARFDIGYYAGLSRQRRNQLSICSRTLTGVVLDFARAYDLLSGRPVMVRFRPLDSGPQLYPNRLIVAPDAGYYALPDGGSIGGPHLGLRGRNLAME